MFRVDHRSHLSRLVELVADLHLRQSIDTLIHKLVVDVFVDQPSRCVAANLAGAAVFSIAVAKLRVFDPEILMTFTRIGREAIAPDIASLFVRGIFAGWLIALMVWLLPYAESARVAVIVILVNGRQTSG